MSSQSLVTGVLRTVDAAPRYVGQVEQNRCADQSRWRRSERRTATRSTKNDRGHTLRSYLPGLKEDQSQPSLAGQAVGIKEVHDDIWLVSFMNYGLGYFDLETRVLEPLENPFGQKVSPM
jgi:hypothetical protein